MDQFWAKVRKGDGCWEWQGAKNWAGYGFFSLEKKRRLAHRVSFALANGPIPDGMCICHHCDNPPCVRPDHLFLGTLSDNAKDMYAKGRGYMAYGELGTKSKLRNEEVRQIRCLLALGITQKWCADAFGVSNQLISTLSKGRIWRHI